MKLSGNFIRESAVMLAVLGFFAWLFFFSGALFHTHASNDPNREALLQLYHAIQVGAAPSEVREAFKTHASPQLRLFDKRDADWQIRMPMEFGASDWKLMLDFEDGRVVRVRVLTADGPPPEDGPPDKQKLEAEPNVGAKALHGWQRA